MHSEFTTFWNYLKVNKVKIPIIQRDYAQGRDDKFEVRKRFLKSLKGAFSPAPQNKQPKLPAFFSWLKKNGKKQVSSEKCRYGIRQKLPLAKNITLDFIYGVSSGNAIHPLDGQQRLTTLWLLHWYVAAKAGKTGPETDVSNVLKNFSYETRCSSRDFCEKLAEFQPDFSQTKSISEQIRNQTWFNSAWIQDPTISGMLRMLSGDERYTGEDNIEAVFDSLKNSKTHWDQLTARAEKCPIRFYAFDIGAYGLTDDLYIKMNARGEQLTAFENFKADLIDWVSKNQGADAAVKLASKIDNVWTDIFWDKRLRLPKKNEREPSVFEKKWANRVDEIFLAFINRFWFNYMIALGDFTNVAYGEMSFYNDELKYDSFDDQYISQHGVTLTPPEVAQALTALSNTLDNYAKVKDNPIIKGFLIPRWKDDEDSKDKYGELIIPEYYVNGSDSQPVKPLSLKRRAVFFAACKFIEKLPDTIPDDVDKNLKDWHRVVWNIVENASFDISSMKGLLKLIDELANKSSQTDYGVDIIKFLSEVSDINSEVPDKKNEIKSNFASDQVREECLKASLWASNWETAIEDAEKLPFTKGKIIAFLKAAHENGEYNLVKFNNIYTKCKEAFPDPRTHEGKNRWAGSFKKLLTWCTDKDLIIEFAYDFITLKNSIFDINFDDDDWAAVKYLRNGLAHASQPQEEWARILLDNWDDLKPFEKDYTGNQYVRKRNNMVYLYRTKKITRAFWLSKNNIDFLKKVVDDWQHGTTDGIYRWVSISDDGNVEVAANQDGIIRKDTREVVVKWADLWGKVNSNNGYDIKDIIKNAIDNYNYKTD